MIEKHRSLVKDRDDLAASSQDASRLLARPVKGEKRDPTRLLREEKMRKRIAKDLPRIEIELRKILEDWEDEYGRPFLVHGERYLDDLANASSKSAAPARSKTPSNAPPSVQPRSAKAAPSVSRAGTLRGPPPPRSHTPTAARNPLASSVRPPSSAASSHFGATMRPASVASTNFSASVVANATSGIPRSPGRMSPSKLPAISARAPLSTMQHGNNSPERRPRPAILGHGRDDFKGTAQGLMGPPRGLPPTAKDVYMPPTPTPMGHSDMGERSASIVRHVDPEDVYNDSNQMRSPRAYQPHRPDSAFSRPPSELQYYPPSSSRPASRFDYPSAPPLPMSRQISNTSSVMTTTSAVSGSENWETYTDVSDEYEPETDARADYYSKIRAAKRGTPDDGYDSATGPGKKIVRAYGLGIGGGGALRAIGQPRHAGAKDFQGVEAGWTDDCGETF